MPNTAPATRLDAITNGADPGRPHVVIVGGGFGGPSCANGLGRAKLRVTVIDRRNYHLFQPLLYQVATAALSTDAIAEPIRHILHRHRNTTVLLGEVTGVDTARKQVLLGEDRLDYDALVLATGASHSYFGHPEWARFAPGLKTLPDAVAIRTRLLGAFERAEMTLDAAERERLMTVVVVGGGPTGVEMAGAVAELTRRALVRDFRNIAPETARIVLVEGLPRLLGPFPEPLSAYALTTLQRLGVAVRTGAPVSDITEHGVKIGDEWIPAATVVWSAGVAASPAGRWLGVKTDRAGRVPVGPDLRAIGLDDVYVIGDTAAATEDGKPLPGLAQVATRQGQYLARALPRRLLRGEVPPPFHYGGLLSLATIGGNRAIADFGRFQLTGFVAWLFWSLVHVYLLIGFEKRLLVGLEWIWAYITDQRGARLIVTMPEQPPAPPA